MGGMSNIPAKFAVKKGCSINLPGTLKVPGNVLICDHKKPHYFLARECYQATAVVS